MLIQTTCPDFQIRLFHDSVCSDWSLPLSGLKVTDLEGFVSSWLREGVNQYALAVVAAASQVAASFEGISSAPFLYYRLASEGSVPGSFIAVIPVIGQPSPSGGATVGWLVLTEPATGPLLLRRIPLLPHLVRN